MKAKFVRGDDSRNIIGIGTLRTQRFESIHLMKEWINKILPIVFSSGARDIADRMDKRRFKNISVNYPDYSIYIALFDLFKKFFKSRNDVYVSPSEEITLDEILNFGPSIDLVYNTIWKSFKEYWDKRFRENPEDLKEIQWRLFKN